MSRKAALPIQRHSPELPHPACGKELYVETDAAFDALGAEIRQLEGSIVESRQALKRSSRTAVVISLLLCLTVSVFLLLNYVTLSTSWASENFSTSMQQELEDFGPVLVSEINQLGQEILPTLAREGRIGLSERGPELTDAVQTQLGLFQTDLHATLHSELERLQLRVTDRALREIYANFPTLSSDSQQKQLAQRFRTTMESALIDGLLQVENSFAADVSRVQESLLQLDLTDRETDTTELQKRFLQLWLQLLDQEIMEL